VRRGEPHPLETVDASTRAQQLAERLPVAELDAVGVDVLAEQRDLADPLVDEGADLGEDVAGSAVLLLAAQRRHDAEGAGVVAAHGYRHPGGVRRLTLGREGAWEDVERLEDLDLRLLLHPCALEEDRQRADVVRAEHHVHPWRPAGDLAAVLLREAAPDGDLHAGVLGLDRRQVPEVPVEPVVGVLPHRAGVEDDDVGLGIVGRRDVAGPLKQAGEPLGVVDVHLAPVGADLVRACAHDRSRVRAGAALPDRAVSPW
jgi:hypothetical protein